MKRKVSSLLAIILVLCMFAFAACSTNTVNVPEQDSITTPTSPAEDNSPDESEETEIEIIPPVSEETELPAVPPASEELPSEEVDSGVVESSYYTPGLAFYFTENYTAFEVAKGLADTSDGIVIPEIYNYLPVIGIKDYGFENCEGEFKVTLPATIRYIGVAAFKNSGITEINLPVSAVEIGAQAFYGCPNLKAMEIPANVESIGEEAFINCDSLSVLSVSGNNGTYMSDENCIIVRETNMLIVALSDNIPDGVETVSNVFKGDKTLTSIVIPASVKHIADEAFADCTNLTKVEFSNFSTLETIGKNAFYGCTSLRYIVNQPNTIKSIGEAAFYGCTSLTEFLVSRSVTSVGEQAFWNCLNLKKMEFRANINELKAGIIGDTVETLIIANVKVIGKDTFRNYTNLKNLVFTYDMDELAVLRSKLEKIDEGAFFGCANLISVTMELRDTNPLQSIEAYAFANCVSLKNFKATFFTGGSFKKIGQGAFQYCTALESFELDAENASTDFCLNIIETEAFLSCINLRTVMIPNVKELGNRAYSGCGFEGLVLPKDLIKVGTDVFMSCVSLDSVSFARGNMMDSIEGMFKNCTALKRLDLPKEVVTIKSYAFKNIVSLEYLYVESGSKLRYIESFAFSNCVNLKEVSFTVGSEECKLESIGNNAFDGCVNLRLFLPAVNLKKISEYAFMNCRSLEGFYFGNQLTSIGNYAFSGCASLFSNGSDLKLPDTLETLSTGSFFNCLSLTRIKLPAKLKAIYREVFMGCLNLTTIINFPETLAQIGDRSFYGCANLSSIDGKNSFKVPNYLLPELGYDVFYGCYKIKFNFTATEEMMKGTLPFKLESFSRCGGVEVTFSPEVTSIPSYKFFGMNSLTKIIFPANSGLKRIEHSAFYDCPNLKEIYNEEYKNNFFPLSLEYIGEAAFGRTGFVNLNFYNTLKEITGTAFSENPHLKTVYFQLESQLKEFYMYFFKDCPNLEELRIPECVSRIQSNYLADYPNIVKVSMTGKVVQIDDFAFIDLKKLEQFEFELYEGPNREGLSDLVSIGNYAFAGCSMLKNSITSNMLYIPASVKTIGDYAFYECSSIYEVSFIEGSLLESIGNYAFKGCTSAVGIRLGRTENLKTIGDYAFANCTSITGSFVLLKGVTSIGYRAFYCWMYYQAISVDGGEHVAKNVWRGGWNQDCDALIQYKGVHY